MQIFWLDEDPEQNARMYNDKHCSKIILEIGQIISTAARLRGVEDERLYRKTHTKHPCVEWAAESKQNIFKALELMKHLNEEKKRRFESGNHLTYTKLYENIDWQKLLEQHTFPSDEETVPPQAFQDVPEAVTEGETFEQVIRGYKAYYRQAKAEISEYNHSEKPDFMQGAWFSQWVYKS